MQRAASVAGGAPAAGSSAGAGEAATVFVVDDDPFTLSIAEHILRASGYEVEVFDEPGAFLAREPFRRHGCAVLDMKMPGLSGLELQRAIAGAGGDLPILFLSGATDVRESVTAMREGALDFLFKPIQRDELLAAVAQAVARSGRARALKAERETYAGRFAQLTPREREVCERMARGMLSKQIAADLELSEQTVKVHRARVMEKMMVESIAELSVVLLRLRDGG